MKASKSLFLGFLFFFLLASVGKAQDPFYIHYNIEDGLPSSEVYKVMLDENGKVLIITDRGICFFDGYDFKTYTTQDGLADNTHFSSCLSEDGIGWFLAYTGGVSILEDRRFYPYPHNEYLQNLMNGRWWGNIVPIGPNEVYIWRNYYSGLQIHHLKNNLPPKKKSLEEILTDHEVVLSTDQHQVFQLGQELYIFEGTYIWEVQPLNTADGIFYFFYNKFNKKLIKITADGKVVNEYLDGQRVDDLYGDKLGDIWACTDSGLVHFSKENHQEAPTTYFNGSAITGITEDREGNYWMSSLKSGVFFIPSFEMHTIQNNTRNKIKDKVLTLAKLKNHLLFSKTREGIFSINKDFQEQRISPLQASDASEIGNLVVSPSEVYYSWGHRVLEENGKLRYSWMQLEQNVKKIGRIVFPWKDDLILTEMIPNIVTLSRADNGKYKVENKAFLKNRPRSVWLQDFAHTWIGTLDGIYLIKDQNVETLQKVGEEFPCLNSRINDVQSDQYENLWVATMGNGLVYKTIDTVFQITTEDGLNSDLVSTIYIANDSTLWIGSNKGLNKITYFWDVDTNAFQFQNVQSYQRMNGLLSNYVNDIEYWEEHLWVATNKGISYFKPAHLERTFPEVPLYLEDFKVNEESMKLTDELVLEYTQNDIVIRYTGLAYAKPEGKDFYRFRLLSENSDTNWIATNDRTVRFNDLLPGSYTFEVNAQNKSHEWNSKVLKQSFKIQYHLVQRLWFKIVAFALWFVLGYFVITKRVQNVRQKEAQKRRLQEAELSALRNQMNPHFVFNSLNSIQHYIFTNDIENASNYLSKFSRLMRDSLQFSRLQFISLFDELRFLKNYLDLEKMRFGDRFEYTIHIDSGIPQRHVKVPALLLQPILENATKHAFKNIDYVGLLEIEIAPQENSDYLRFTIRDNGPGVNPKLLENPKTEGRKSLGMAIVRNRIELIREEYNSMQCSIKFINLEDLEGKKTGLQVVIILPVKVVENV